MHRPRVICMVFANSCFFMGLASVPLADAVAFFLSGLCWSRFFYCLAAWNCGFRRWSATLIGLSVLIIVRRGTSAFQIVSILLIMATVGYRVLHNFNAAHRWNRKSCNDDLFHSAHIYNCVAKRGYWTLRRWAQFVTYIFTAWMADPITVTYMDIALAGHCKHRRCFLVFYDYQHSEAAFVAPFEYVAMAMAVIWGYLIFDDFPDAASWLKMILIIASGIYGASWQGTAPEFDR